MQRLLSHPQLVVRQRKELVELFGFETRNKYEIDGHDGKPVLYCAEQQKGFLGFLARQFLGHWRTFELHFFDHNRQAVWRAVHPFRFIFQCLELYDQQGRKFGLVEWRWGIFRKRFRLTDIKTGKTFDINSGFFRFWTFIVTYHDQEIGKVLKQWSGALKELFTDSDNFLVEFSATLSDRERALILSTAILIDLQYFEGKGSGGVIDLIGD